MFVWATCSKLDPVHCWAAKRNRDCFNTQVIHNGGIGVCVCAYLIYIKLTKNIIYLYYYKLWTKPEPCVPLSHQSVGALEEILDVEVEWPFGWLLSGFKIANRPNMHLLSDLPISFQPQGHSVHINRPAIAC